jgi:hypothetical protein
MKRCIEALFVVVILSAVPAQALTPAERAAKNVALLEAVADATVKDKDSCDAMAADVSKLADTNAALLAEIRAAAATESAADKKKFADQYGARLKAAQQKITNGMMKCSGNAAVKAAFAKLN